MGWSADSKAGRVGVRTTLMRLKHHLLGGMKAPRGAATPPWPNPLERRACVLVMSDSHHS